MTLDEIIAKCTAAGKRNPDRIANALSVAISYGQIDGAHHKTWVIDQMVRALAGGRYDELIRIANDGEDGPDTYAWDTGTPP